MRRAVPEALAVLALAPEASEEPVDAELQKECLTWQELKSRVRVASLCQMLPEPVREGEEAREVKTILPAAGLPPWSCPKNEEQGFAEAA